MAEPKSLEGQLVAPPKARFGLVASRFNSFIVEQLVSGCVDGLTRHGVSADRITLVHVPSTQTMLAGA